MPPRASLRTAIIALAVLASLLPAAGRAEAPVEALREAMVLRLEAMCRASSTLGSISARGTPDTFSP